MHPGDVTSGKGGRDNMLRQPDGGRAPCAVTKHNPSIRSTAHVREEKSSLPIIGSAAL